MGIISAVRRILPSLACLIFAVSLHASVPATVSTPKFNQNVTSPGFDQDLSLIRQQLPITAAPADTVSFYLEYYAIKDAVLPKAPRKPGLFRRFTSAIRRTAQKVNFISN